MSKDLAYAYRVLGFERATASSEERRNCRRGVKRRLKALPADSDIPAVAAGRELIRRGCRLCGGCWLSAL